MQCNRIVVARYYQMMYNMTRHSLIVQCLPAAKQYCLISPVSFHCKRVDLDQDPIIGS